MTTRHRRYLKPLHKEHDPKLPKDDTGNVDKTHLHHGHILQVGSPETQGLHTVDNLLMVHCLTEAYSRPYDIATHAGIRPKTWPQKTLKKKTYIRISNRLPHGPRPLSRPADYLLVEQQVLFPVVQVLLAQLGLLPAQSLILSLI